MVIFFAGMALYAEHGLVGCPVLPGRQRREGESMEARLTSEQRKPLTLPAGASRQMQVPVPLSLTHCCFGDVGQLCSFFLLFFWGGGIGGRGDVRTNLPGRRRQWRGG